MFVKIVLIVTTCRCSVISKTCFVKKTVCIVVQQVTDIDYTANSELKKLKFFGAGPKTVVPLQISKGQCLATV